MKSKIGIIGFFDYEKQNSGGGVIKTCNFEIVLKERYGQENVITLDRAERINDAHWILRLIVLCKSSDVVFAMYPMPKMIQKLTGLILLLKKMYKFKLIYPVIGGWLPDYLTENEKSKEQLLKFDLVLVETYEMKNKLRMLGLKNVEFMPNFSLRKPINKVKAYSSEKFKFCIFSRVVKEKGIELAIDAINQANKQLNGRYECLLDIYGLVDDAYVTQFEEIVKKNSNIVTYKGLLQGTEILNVLSDYYMLLFPTFYSGEGFPGTLVETLMAGLPAIVSKWKYNSEIISEGKTGILFSLDIKDDLENKIVYAVSNRKKINAMRENCLRESEKYIPENLFNPIFKMIEL